MTRAYVVIMTTPARVSAAEANRHFSKLLGRVRAGETVVITSHGTPVATLAPPSDPEAEAKRAAAAEALLHRLRTQPPRFVKPWTRDELYVRGPWPEFDDPDAG